MRARIHLRPTQSGARYVVVPLFLLAAGACSAENDGPDANAYDGAADRTSDAAVEPGTIDSADDRSRADAEAGNDDRATDMGRDLGVADTVLDGTLADGPFADGPGTADQRSDASELGPVEGGADVNDGSIDGDGEAGVVDGTGTSDSAADRSADSAGPDGADGGTRKPSGVFGGGPFYHDADTVMPTMRASGFSTMVLWSIHVRTNGDLVLNDVPLFANGIYVGSDAAWPAKVATLKTAPTSVTRVEFSVGAGGTTDFESIESLIGSQGTGPTSILYRNFNALKAAIPITDAINFDDESNYDVASTVAFSVMLGDLGYKVTLCPYTNSTFWTSVFNQTNTQRPGLVDRVLLQVYAGGASNNPVTWSGYFGGLQVEAGLWSRHATNCATGDTPSSVRTKMTNWRTGIAGGWMWLLDDMLTCDGQYPLEDYAAAINEALNP
ncbi:MAG TPA: hypothetical protein VK540_22415 [Polyangiaceae bacterium]|nr:hypothetical protein [Polyangiaceae bacterium]